MSLSLKVSFRHKPRLFCHIVGSLDLVPAYSTSLSLCSTPLWTRYRCQGKWSSIITACIRRTEKSKKGTLPSAWGFVGGQRCRGEESKQGTALPSAWGWPTLPARRPTKSIFASPLPNRRSNGVPEGVRPVHPYSRGSTSHSPNPMQICYT